MKNSRKSNPPTDWRKKFYKTIKIADTPPLNREGFWKKHQPVEPDVEHKV